MPNGELRGGFGGEISPERPRGPETAKESEPQPEATSPDAGVGVVQPSAPAPAPVPVAKPSRVVAAEPKDELHMKVERILEENLWELYFALPKETRVRFRAEGERTAAEMRQMIEQKKVKPHAIHVKVDRWLRTIPKVNRWFLLQEGKIKTDNVMAMVRERHGEIA